MTAHQPTPDPLTYVTVPDRRSADGRRAQWHCRSCDRYLIVLTLPNRETPVYRHLPR